MQGRILISEPHITIAYDVIHDWLHANWTGEQTESTVRDGCGKMLDYLRQMKTTKVLNDNTHVKGMWSGASEWVARNWFPAMYESGCHYFAWIYSPDVYSKLSSELTLKEPIKNVIIATFEDMDTAKSWLRIIG